MSVDVEVMLTRFLRAQDEVITLVGDRVYTDLPHDRIYPLVLLHRTGGAPLLRVPPNWLVENEVTFDFYGGTHKVAQQIMSTCVDVLMQRLPGEQPEGVVTAVRQPTTSYTPDEESVDDAGHGRPRFQVVVNVLTHP